jgi:hypothetical protein
MPTRPFGSERKSRSGLWSYCRIERRLLMNEPRETGVIFPRIIRSVASPESCTIAPVGHKAMHCPQDIHIADFPSSTQGRSSFSVSLMTDIRQTSEQVPYRVQVSRSNVIVMNFFQLLSFGLLRNISTRRLFVTLFLNVKYCRKSH